MDNLLGLHHVTAITSSAEKIYDFYTNILGMRLVKKSVNQDDIQTYHLYFADDRGNPGTNMTFFDFKGIRKAFHGTNEISRTSFRVPNDTSILYWIKRFKKYAIKHTEVKEMFGKKVIYFYDFDDQQYALFSDENNRGSKAGNPWHKGPVPDEFAINGLGPIFFNVNDLASMTNLLTQVFGFRKISKQGSNHLFEVGEGGNGAAVIIEENLLLPASLQGYGGVHHVAFRVKNRKVLDDWTNYLDSIGAPNSGYVDRYYFESVYTRLYPGILFELATDEPGFIDADENYETLGETLALPPLYKDKRDYVESVVKLFDTKRSDKIIKKEYL